MYSLKWVHLSDPQVHLMCLLMRGRYLNQVCNDLDLRGIALSLIPAEVSRVPARKFDVPTHTRFVNWYKETVSIDQRMTGDSQANLVGHIMDNCFISFFILMSLSVWFDPLEKHWIFNYLNFPCLSHRIKDITVCESMKAFSKIYWKLLTTSLFFDKAENLTQRMETRKVANRLEFVLVIIQFISFICLRHTSHPIHIQILFLQYNERKWKWWYFFVIII